MARKFESIDPIKLYCGLKRKDWKLLLENSMNKRSAQNLVKWRYGLQAGLHEANRSGKITSEKIDIWVIARLKDLENAMKYILKERYPNPMDDPRNVGTEFAAKATAAKRIRDREFQKFLMESNF